MAADNTSAEAHTGSAASAVPSDASDGVEAPKGGAAIEAAAESEMGKTLAESAAEVAMPTAAVNAEVRAKNSLINPVFNGSVYFRDAVGKPVLAVDRTSEASSLEHTYVDVGIVADLCRELTTGTQVIAVCGPAGIGKRTASFVALRRRLDRVVIEVPGDLGFDDLIQTIEQVKDTVDQADFVYANADADILSGMNDFQLDAICKALTRSGKSHLLATTRGSLVMSKVAITVVPATVAPIDELIAAYFRRNTVDDSVRERIDRLSASIEGLSFSALRSLVLLLEKDPCAEDDRLLSTLPNLVVTNALEEWLQHGRSALEVATLACVATCEGVPRTELDQEISILESAIVDERVTPSAPPTFGGWSADSAVSGLVALRTRRLSTHFGSHDEDTYALEEHLDRAAVLKYLWAKAGPAFRRGFVDWIGSLATKSSLDLRLGASVAAGVLLTVDARYVEAALVRPWAKSADAQQIGTAARALGVPTMLNDPSQVGHRLAKTWIRDANDSLRCCAMLAYGGPLGAWDVGCGAPVRLWLAAAEQDDLQRFAYRCLAGLCAAGSEAAEVRHAVLTLLNGQLAQRAAIARRALDVFAEAVDALCGDSPIQRDSLAALLDNTEPAAREAFVSLIAKTWSAPYAKHAGRRTLRVLATAADRQIIALPMLVDLVRAAKKSAKRDGNLAALGGGLRRALLGEHASDRHSPAVEHLLDHFFPNLVG